MPGDSLRLAGTTVSSPVRFAALVTASMLGSLLGESIGYRLGRRYGRRVRHSRRGRRLRPDAWTKAERSSAGVEDPRWQPPGLSRSSMPWFPLSRPRSACATGASSAGAQ